MAILPEHTEGKDESPPPLVCLEGHCLHKRLHTLSLTHSPCRSLTSNIRTYQSLLFNSHRSMMRLGSALVWCVVWCGVVHGATIRTVQLITIDAQTLSMAHQGTLARSFMLWRADRCVGATFTSQNIIASAAKATLNTPLNSKSPPTSHAGAYPDTCVIARISNPRSVFLITPTHARMHTQVVPPSASVCARVCC